MVKIEDENNNELTVMPGNEVVKSDINEGADEDIKEEITEEITEVKTQQTNTFTSEFHSNTETKTTSTTVQQFTNGTSVYSTNSNTQKITKTIINNKTTTTTTYSSSNNNNYLTKSNSQTNALEFVSSDIQKPEEFKSNDDNNNSTLPSSIVEVRRTPKSASRTSNSQGSINLRTSNSMEKQNIDSSINETVNTTTNDNSNITNNNSENNEIQTNSNNIKEIIEEKIESDNTKNDVTQMDLQQAGSLRGSYSMSALNNNDKLKLTGNAMKLNNRSKSSQNFYKNQKVLGSLTTMNPSNSNTIEILNNHSNTNNTTTENIINKNETDLTSDINTTTTTNDNNSISNNITTENNNTVTNDNTADANSNSNKIDENNEISKNNETKIEKISSKSLNGSRTLKSSKSSRKKLSITNISLNPTSLESLTTSEANIKHSQSKSNSNCKKSSRNGSISNSKNCSRKSSCKNSRKNSRSNSKSNLNEKLDKEKGQKESNGNISSPSSTTDINKEYFEKIIMYNTNKNRIAYMKYNKDYEEENKPIIIQSSNNFDININGENIHKIVVKIDQNQDTIDFMKSLDQNTDRNICYTDYLDINRGNKYGTCTVQILEATFKKNPCYYVSKKVTIYDKTNNKIIYELEFISYVTPKLKTLCQRLKLKQDDGVTYNQHVIYDFDNDVTIIEQCYYESDISIKQIFDCDQYLSEGAIEILNRLIINNEVKPRTYNFLTFVKGVMYKLDVTTYPDIKKAYLYGKRLPYPVLKIENEILPRSESISIYEEVDSFKLYSDYQKLTKKDGTTESNVVKEENGNVSNSNNTLSDVSTPIDDDNINIENIDSITDLKDDIREDKIYYDNQYDYIKHPHLKNKNKKGTKKRVSSSPDLNDNIENEEEIPEGIMLGDLDIPNFTISNSQNNVTFEQLVKNINNNTSRSDYDVNSSLGSCRLVEIAKNNSTSLGVVTVDDINLKKGVIPIRKNKKKKNNDEDSITDFNYLETRICCPKRGCLIIEDDTYQHLFENKIRFNDTVPQKSFLDGQENLSIYREYRDTFSKKYGRYIKHNESLKNMLQDFVHSIFLNKPKDVYEYTKNYFSF